MKRLKLGIIALGGALVLSAGGIEAEAQEVELSGNVSLASDYAFRGISQTLEEPAVQGGLDVTGPSGVYLGAWGSSVNFGEDLPRAQLELDVYGGIAPSFGGFDFDLGALYYMYPGAESSNNYDFLEVYGGAGRTVGPVGLGVSAAYSPEFFAASGAGVWLGAEASVEVPGAPLTLDGSLGQQSIEENDVWGTPDYMAWSAGVGTELFGASIGATLTGTNLEEGECFGGSELCETRVILSVGRGM